MLRIVVVFALIFFWTNITLAQTRATTESGNKVILYDNGTWQYEEKSVTSEDATAIEVAGGTTAAILVDSSREIETELQEFFYLPSPRLVKFFGEHKGKIRCKLSCSNNLGVVKVHFSWEFPVVDGNRYFGFFDEGSKVTFTILDGQKVNLTMGEESSLKRYEKHNYSVIANRSQPLTQEQMALLTTQPVRKMEVEWRKKPEEYEPANSRFLMDTLPTVF